MTTTASRKYTPPRPVDLPDRQWPARRLERAPQWCSVDLRDGNQALATPLDPARKLEYFRLLCAIGFKDIEVSFPSASQDDFDFTRRLIETGEIPPDVWIMGLTQCRENLISRTFESFRGAPRAVVHAYLATSDLHLGRVFGLGRDEAMKQAVSATRQIRALADGNAATDFRYEFSPEEFTDTDPRFAVDICTAVVEAWGKATPERKMILNLPATVERRPPNEYADLIEWFCRHFPYRNRVTISLHAHNDQGMAVAAVELALLAGGERVEGTLFGHGERTGNLDLVTMAENLASRGIDTGLDFSRLEDVAQTVERLTNMPIHPRQPYAGELVFTAFSGSHQDAIRKGLAAREKSRDTAWYVPYLHIDPADVGRAYERLIRINSQSGKGGIAWILEREFGLQLPKSMHPEVGRAVQDHLDRAGRELTSEEVRDVFLAEFVQPEGPYRLIGFWPMPDPEDPSFVDGQLKLVVNGAEREATARGNGPLSAFVYAAAKMLGQEFTVSAYHEQAMGTGADTTAYAYVQLAFPDGTKRFGAGENSNIGQAAVRAAVAALNRRARR